MFKDNIGGMLVVGILLIIVYTTRIQRLSSTALLGSSQ